MRKLVLCLFALLVLFALNLMLYAFNDDYRFFVKKLKYSDEIITVDSGNKISDEKDIIDIPLEPEVSTVKVEDFIPEEKELILTDNEKRILSNFLSYNLERIDIHSSLFDLTTEYPDDYFEYIGQDGDIILYLLPTRKYEQIFEVFDVISYDLPFELNEVNNFWQRSFFINVDEWFADNFVRLVVKSRNGVFWLKIKKDLYNEAKEILKNI